MEEPKTYDAEREYLKSQQDTCKITYEHVRIKNGDAVLKNILIDEVIREIVNKNQEENQHWLLHLQNYLKFAFLH